MIHKKGPKIGPFCLLSSSAEQKFPESTPGHTPYPCRAYNTHDTTAECCPGRLPEWPLRKLPWS